MELTLIPCKLRGTVPAIPSKSQAHRLLLCAAFADAPTVLECPRINRDLEATAECLRALGAEIIYDGSRFRISPISRKVRSAVLPCGESGSTLRFLLPVAGALGIDATFELEGRLPHRPLEPLWSELRRMGCRLSRPTETTIRCQGNLRSGAYQIRGDVSSQFVTGLLFALSLLENFSTLELTGAVESAPYIQMTLDAMEDFGSLIEQKDRIFSVFPAGFRTLGHYAVEGDWSNAAFWLTAKALGSSIEVTGLNPDSAQGDRKISVLLSQADWNEIDVSDIPDLVPVLAVAAAAGNGARFTHAGRLRLKESDRLESVARMMESLGGRAEISGESLTIFGGGLTGGQVDACGDHRIAMAAAIAATVCREPVLLSGAEAVGKSDPFFWKEYKKLGGIL